MDKHKLRERCFVGSWIVVALFLATLMSPFASAVGEDATDSKTAVAIQSMRDEMSKLKLTVEQDKKWLSAELKAEPILHYTDPQRSFPDATLWVWVLNGRPVAFSKCERLGGKPPQTQFCVVAAHEPRIVVRWPDGIVWKSRDAGIRFQKLENGEQPQKTAQLRMIQLRGLAKKFQAVTTDEVGQKEEMRLLSQPIHRYSNAGQSLVDGAVFALTSNGTNPDALLMIQVSQDSNGNAVWEYGCVAMSGDAISIELDKNLVFKHDSKKAPGDFGHWLWSVVPTN